RRRKPRVQDVIFLTDAGCGFALSFKFGYGFSLCFGDDPFVFIVKPGWDTLPPPQLTGDTPIFYIFHPMLVRSVKLLWNKFDGAVSNIVQCRLCKIFHFQKPLHRQLWFNGSVCTLG